MEGFVAISNTFFFQEFRFGVSVVSVFHGLLFLPRCVLFSAMFELECLSGWWSLCWSLIWGIVSYSVGPQSWSWMSHSDLEMLAMVVVSWRLCWKCKLGIYKGFQKYMEQVFVVVVVCWFLFVCLFCYCNTEYSTAFRPISKCGSLTTVTRWRPGRVVRIRWKEMEPGVR